MWFDMVPYGMMIGIEIKPQNQATTRKQKTSRRRCLSIARGFLLCSLCIPPIICQCVSSFYGTRNQSLVFYGIQFAIPLLAARTWTSIFCEGESTKALSLQLVGTHPLTHPHPKRTVLETYSKPAIRYPTQITHDKQIRRYRILISEAVVRDTMEDMITPMRMRAMDEV